MTGWHARPGRFGRALFCSRCARTFSANDRSVDLTPTSGMEPQVYRQPIWGGTALFRCATLSWRRQCSSIPGSSGLHCGQYLTIWHGPAGARWCRSCTSVAGAAASGGRASRGRRQKWTWPWATCRAPTGMWATFFECLHAPGALRMCCMASQRASSYDLSTGLQWGWLQR